MKKKAVIMVGAAFIGAALGYGAATQLLDPAIRGVHEQTNSLGTGKTSDGADMSKYIWTIAGGLLAAGAVSRLRI